eukprot:350905-Chlamydomonas_euryale.AAC.8
MRGQGGGQGAFDAAAGRESQQAAGAACDRWQHCRGGDAAAARHDTTEVPVLAAYNISERR